MQGLVTMRKISAVLLLLTAVSPLFAQSKKQPPPPAPAPLAERIDVNVVNVDVTVTDRRGDSVSGLTKDDFEVFEDGKRQPVTNFYFVEDAPKHGVKPGDAKAAAAAEPESLPEKYRRKVLVLIDNANTTMHARNEALARLEEFIRDHFEDGRYDWSVAMVGSTARLLLPLTSDKERLHAAIAAVRRSGSTKGMTAPIQRAEMGVLSEGSKNAVRKEDPEATTLFNKNPKLIIGDRIFMEEANISEQTMMAKSSVGAISEVARAFATTEGKKIILLVTGYLPLGTSAPSAAPATHVGNHMADMQRNQRQLISLRDRLIREANASNASFYIIGAEGLQVPEQASAFEAPTPGSNAPDTSAMYWLARETGGVYMPGNSIAKSFQEFDRRSSNFYSLGYTPQHQADDRYHRISVRVKGHPGLHLQYRDGYSSVGDDVQIERALRTIIGVTLQPSTLPVSLVADRPVYGKTLAMLPLSASMKMDDLQYITDATGSRTRLDVWVSVFDNSGRNITLTKFVSEVGVGSGESVTGPMTVTIPGVALRKGSYRVVIAVRDQLTDRVGVAVRKVDL
jgi:VWFA-related protein